jgi:hypothetical protein
MDFTDMLGSGAAMGGSGPTHWGARPSQLVFPPQKGFITDRNTPQHFCSAYKSNVPSLFSALSKFQVC